jgi:hypothetical protein
MMKGICFTFDAIGQWSDHERSKIWCRMKVGVEWTPSVAGRPPSPFFPSTIFPFTSTTTPWGQIGELLATCAGRPARP